MNINEVKYSQALEQNKRLEEALEKEKDRNKKMEKTLEEVTSHNIALRSELKSIGVNINLIG